MSNREWWLIPWSVGWECRTKKPDSGDAIHVIEKAAFESLKESLILAKKQRDEWEYRYLTLLKKITDEIPLL